MTVKEAFCTSCYGTKAGTVAAPGVTCAGATKGSLQQVAERWAGHCFVGDVRLTSWHDALTDDKAWNGSGLLSRERSLLSPWFHKAGEVRERQDPATDRRSFFTSLTSRVQVLQLLSGQAW